MDGKNGRREGEIESQHSARFSRKHRWEGDKGGDERREEEGVKRGGRTSSAALNVIYF